MLELYFGFKFWGFILFVSICVLAISLIFIKSYLDGRKEMKIKKYLEKIGFQYYIQDVASMGGGTFYGFKRDNVRFRDKEVYKMKLRDVKKKYK